MSIYEPAEDSFLINKWLQLAESRVLDMGTGSGIQALSLIKNPHVREVVAVDINKEAVERLQQEITEKRLRKIKAVYSDLFEQVTGQFNYIIFNPPYLPQDEGITDEALYGGKKGWELSERFFRDVSKYLFPDGKILFLFSSLTNRDKINEIIEHYLLQYTLLDQQKLAFEELYVYEITKTPLLRELESKGLEHIHYFSRGKRGVIYVGTLDRSKLIKQFIATKPNVIKVAIKAKRPSSEAQGAIENEAYWLQLLNKRGIGPRFLFAGKGYLVYQFVEGDFILDWIKKNEKEAIIAVLKQVMQQCITLDTLGVNKEEMHHPHKHIIVTKEKRPVLIDFERCSEVSKPKNVTQFLEFLCRITNELKGKQIQLDVAQIREIAREYKETYDSQILKEIFQPEGD